MQLLRCTAKLRKASLTYLVLTKGFSIKISEKFSTYFIFLCSHKVRKYLPRILVSLLWKFPNAEFFLVRIFLYLVRMRENTDQKKLRIWTLSTQCMRAGFSVLSQKYLSQQSSLLPKFWHQRSKYYLSITT